MASTCSLWIGLDLGTTGIKAVVFDDDLGVVATASQECAPDHLAGGAVEADADDWARVSLAVLGEALAHLEESGGERTHVRAVAISSQGITVVPVDAGGRPLRRALSWLDSRAASALPGLAAALATDEWQARTGVVFSEAWVLPRLAWLRQQDPGTAQAAGFSMPLDYVGRALTGVWRSDHSMAGGTMAHDVATRDWAADLLAYAGVTPGQMPALAESGEIVGPLLPAIADELGLERDVVVVTGGQDQKCAAFGAGLDEHHVTVSFGTAAAVLALVGHPAGDGSSTFPYVTPHGWVREGVVPTAGAALRWFSRTASPTADVAAIAQVAASAHPPTGPFFVPHLGGVDPRRDKAQHLTDPRGVFWGLGLETTSADLALAVIEGIAYDVAIVCETVTTTGNGIRVFGGGAQSEVWCSLLADATGRPVEVLATHEAAAAGAARLARLGVTGDPGPGVAVARTVEPSAHAAHVGERFETYRRLRQQIGA